jgi:hypothetical protein
MKPLPKFSIWFVKGSVGALIGATCLFALVHLGLKTPVSELVQPWLVYGGLGILLTPFVYLARRHEVLRKGDWRPLYVTVGLFLMIACPVLFYYASRFGLLSPKDLPGLCVTALVAFPPIFFATYYVSKRFGIPPHRRDHDGTAER